MRDSKYRLAHLGAILATTLAFAQPARAQPRDATGRVSPEVSIPLRDAGGIVRGFMTFRPSRHGPTVITFTDANGRRLNELTGEVPPAAAANPLAGGPDIPPVTLEEKADADADIRFLRDQINSLQRQMQVIVDRINAAARRG